MVAMTLSWFVQQIVGSVIAAIVFTAVGALLVWWKALPFWRKHKPAVMALLYRGTDEP
jgi:hypothetical protein